MFVPFRTARMATVAGMAAVVVALGVTSVSWAAASPAGRLSSAAAVPKCTAGDLGAWIAVDHGGAAAGTLYYPLEFTNLSTHACSLSGFPGVSAVDASGHQLGNSALRVHTSTPHTVVLAPGATAHAIFEYADAEVNSAPGCNPKPASELRIYPPDQHSATHTFFDLESCSAPGHTYLLVQPILPGTGRIS
jgi:hypothetical protein